MLHNSGKWLTDGRFGWRAKAIDAGSVLRLWRGEHEKQVGPKFNSSTQGLIVDLVELQPGAAGGFILGLTFD